MQLAIFLRRGGRGEGSRPGTRPVPRIVSLPGWFAAAESDIFESHPRLRPPECGIDAAPGEPRIL